MSNTEVEIVIYRSLYGNLKKQLRLEFGIEVPDAWERLVCLGQRDVLLKEAIFRAEIVQKATRQKATDAAVKALGNVEGRFRTQDKPLDDRDYLGLRILQRVIDYLRDPDKWMRYRDRGFQTPTATFWEGKK